MKDLQLLFPPEEIHIIVDRLARELRSDFASRNPVLLGVLKGAFIFISDLMRAMKMPFEVDFIQAASYGEKTIPSSQVAIKGDITSDIKGRDVIIVDGIIDSGHTIRVINEYLKAKEPASISVCTLLLRDGEARDLSVDYVGVHIGKGFVVGYGMDYGERYRGLQGLYVINT